MGRFLSNRLFTYIFMFHLKEANMIKRISKKTAKKSYILFIILILTLSISSTVVAAPRVQPLPDSDKVVVVIDPGHGGDNEGTKENGALEKSMTLKTAMAMYDELKKYDNVEVYLTRSSDVGMSIAQRAEFAASVNADFLFSIHYNASLSHELYGSEVWISLYEPYQSYGYQFGCVQMETMGDMGLFLRGVKTRPGDNGDYYGIIRESAALSVPAVIIEHCHVDNQNDTSYCDSDEDLEAFGRADALSAAKYLGLYSTELGVDYSDYGTKLADTSAGGNLRFSANDTTEPDVCSIELRDIDYDTGDISIEISAADYDGMLLYYDYSIDGGDTYSRRYPWPDCNVLTGEYNDTPEIAINIPSKAKPDIIFRAYNMFDLYTESNPIPLDEFLYGKDAVQTDSTAVLATGEAEGAGAGMSDRAEPASGLPGTTTFKPDEVVEEEPQQADFISFLVICLIIVVLLLVTVIISQLIVYGRRRRRRQRRNDPGDDIYHKK